MRPIRALFALLLTAALLPIPALANEGDPRQDPCNDRQHTCTDVVAGTMDCMPESGVAEMLSAVVGSADEGTFQLNARGTNHPGSGQSCSFEVRIRADEIQFNEGWTVGLLGPYGGASGIGSAPCYAVPGAACDTTASFTWWRAQHGVTFDVPFDLVVNGLVVASGRCHYYDPPMWQEIFGGDVVLP